MSLDGIVTRAVVNELNETILRGRIDKIYQQEEDEILMHIYSRGENRKLIISASSNNPRVYLTNNSKTNPQTPPMFCMFLRKHLTRGTILNIEQFHMDRVVFIDISSIDELGLPSEKRLIIEIMGRHSNIILIDIESNKILDSIKRVNYSMSRVRQVLPGMDYQHPKIDDKLNPLYLNRDEFNERLNLSEENMKTFKFFYTNYIGLSPLISKEICFLANIDRNKTIEGLTENDVDSLFNSFISIVDKINNKDFNPMLIKNSHDKGYRSFHCLDIKQFGDEDKIYLDSISKVLDEKYKEDDSSDRISQKSHSIKKSVQTKLKRSENKLSKQKDELLKSKDREIYKVYADIISANLYRIKRGIDEVILENFYTEDMDEIKIPLNVKYTPAENAQRYYKKYSKLKNANILLLKQIPETKEEIDYLENVLNSLENSTEILEIDEIKEELIKEGYLKGRIKKRKKKNILSKPYHYVSSDGFDIYVGKNNKQNDYLTLKFANREDLWLHVQNMPGSHVIVRTNNGQVSDIALEEAATLAAYFSKAKNSNNVSVDYTAKKNVQKARNARTGMVIYNDFNTIFVTPSKNEINKLEKVES